MDLNGHSIALGNPWEINFEMSQHWYLELPFLHQRLRPKHDLGHPAPRHALRQAVLNGRRLAGRYGETLASATLEAYSHLIGLPYGQGLLISVTSFGDDMSL